MHSTEGRNRRELLELFYGGNAAQRTSAREAGTVQTRDDDG
jgi:hypothetical protein